MTARSLGIFVACTATAVFIRVIGRGACRNSEPLREFGLRKLQEGFNKIYIDLADCEGMDSTFLGVFAGFGLALQQRGVLNLLNLAGENLRAFNCLGLEDLAVVNPVPPEGATPFPENSLFEKLPGSDLTMHECTFNALEKALVMLECHEDLCRANERNEEKFRDVKQFLREDIARHAPQSNGYHPSAPSERP